jgi:hypothetical protein
VREVLMMWAESDRKVLMRARKRGADDHEK